MPEPNHRHGSNHVSLLCIHCETNNILFFSSITNSRYIHSRDLATAIILRRFPRQGDRLTGDLFVLQGTFRRTWPVENDHLETTFVYSATVLQQQVIQSRIGSLCVDRVNDGMITYRGNCRSLVTFQFSATNRPNDFRGWFTDKIDIYVEDEASLDPNILQRRLDLGSH